MALFGRPSSSSSALPHGIARRNLEALVRSASVVALLLAGAVAVQPARAAVVETSGGVEHLPPNVLNQIFPLRDGTAPVINEQALGDEAYASATLMGSAGYLQLNGHAIARPPVNSAHFTGTGSGNAGAGLNEAFNVTSATLPFGSPVTIQFSLATARRISSTFDPDSIFFSGSHASPSGHATVNFNGNILSGTFSQNKGNFAENTPPSFSGIFGNNGDSGAATAYITGTTINTTVGSTVSLFVNSGVSAGARCAIGQFAEADVQIALVWGASGVGSDVVLRSTVDNAPLPGTEGVTQAAALEALPAPVPEPGGVGMLTGAGVALLHRRRARNVKLVRQRGLD